MHRAFSNADRGTLAHIFLLVGLMFLFTLFLIFASIGIGDQPAKLSEAQVEQASARIARMSQLRRGEPAKATTVVGPGPATGPAALIQNHCALCHAAGVAGAPLLTDAAEWANRLAQRGLEGLYQSAIQGRGAMPPRAGTPLSDDELRLAVEHMVKQP